MPAAAPRATILFMMKTSPLSPPRREPAAQGWTRSRPSGMAWIDGRGEGQAAQRLGMPRLLHEDPLVERDLLGRAPLRSAHLSQRAEQHDVLWMQAQGVGQLGGRLIQPAPLRQ